MYFHRASFEYGNLEMIENETRSAIALQCINMYSKAMFTCLGRTLTTPRYEHIISTPILMHPLSLLPSGLKCFEYLLRFAFILQPLLQEPPHIRPESLI